MLLLSIIVVLLLVVSCASAPGTSGPEPDEPDQNSTSTVQEAGPASAPGPVVAAEPVFDPSSISQEKYETAKADVQALISNLNRIIRARNYDAWVQHLADSYFEEISSQSFLEEKTEELYRRDQIVAANTGKNPRMVEKKILRTARDYFTHVVVPARSNDWLDDIDFISENRVKAYTVDSRGNRLVLYDLEIINNKWKIIS